jgi:hypothetical protein
MKARAENIRTDKNDPTTCVLAACASSCSCDLELVSQIGEAIAEESNTEKLQFYLE